MEKRSTAIALMGLSVMGATAFGASAATSGDFTVNPVNNALRTVTLDKYTGAEPLSEATVTLQYSFVNTVQGLSERLGDSMQTGLTNEDSNNAEADLSSLVFVDVLGVGEAIDGIGSTQTDTQIIANGQSFDFTGADISDTVTMVFTGSSLAFFEGPGTFDVNLDIDGGWDVFQEGSGGSGSITAIFDSVLNGTVSVDYGQPTVIPTPSAVLMGLAGIGGLALRRRRR